MEWFKCLFCMHPIKDMDLVCAASCDHVIHEWCVETMNTIEDRRCKICEKNVLVHLVFKEFDLERAVQMMGVPIIIKKLEEIAESLKSRDNHSSQLEKSLEKISEKLERLSIEHRALKFEKKEADKRLRQLEAGKELKENEH